MKQDNVCAFIGAYVEQRKSSTGEHSKVTLVTEYCTRGSLLDILGLEDIKLDRLFISSLVHDLLKVILIGLCNFFILYMFMSNSRSNS